MINRKPETSLDEDLVYLGLAPKNLSEEEVADKDAAAKNIKKEEPKAEEPKEGEDEEEEGEEKKPMKKEMPAFVAKKAEEAEEANYAAQLEAAWDLVRSYYTMSEEDDKNITVESLRTVIDAYAFICEAQFNAEKPTEAPDDLAGREADLFPDGENPVKQKATAKSPVAPEWDKEKYGRAKSAKASAAQYQRSAPVKTEGLSDLVADLVAMRDQVVESAPTAETLAAIESLIEGFEAVKTTAGEIASRIGAELSEAKNVSKDDERAKACAYFEGIASDATDILGALAEGTVEISDALEDLKTIREDLKKGFESLKSVK